MGVSESLEGSPRQEFAECLLVSEDFPFINVRKRVPGMAVPEGVAPEFMPLLGEFPEILCLEHWAHMRSLPHETHRNVIRSECSISLQDRTGLKESRARKIVEGK